MTARKRRQYRTGSLYRRKSDGRWLGVIEAGFHKDGTRRRITVSAKTEPAAKQKLKDKLREAGATQVAVAATPDEDALFDALDRAPRRQSR